MAYKCKALGHVLIPTTPGPLKDEETEAQGAKLPPAPRHAALSQGQDFVSGAVGKMPRQPDPRTSRSLT